MKNSCFYFSVMSADGEINTIKTNEFKAEKTIKLTGNSNAVKQKLFGFIKDELNKRKTDFSELCCADDICGIHCSELNFFISDRNISDEKIINLSDYQNKKIISDAEENIFENQKYFNRATRFFSACRLMKKDMQRLENAYINRRKIENFCRRFWQKNTNGLIGKTGEESKRFVTCPTADGIELNMEAFDIYSEKMLVIRDRTGAVSRLIIDRLRRYALGSGYDIISCPCCIDSDEIEHIIIPALNLGIFTSRYYHRDDFPNARIIYAKRFLYHSVEDIKQRTDFTAQAYKNMMNEAFVSLEKSDKCEQKLDEIFLSATDFYSLFSDISQLIF